MNLANRCPPHAKVHEKSKGNSKRWICRVCGEIGTDIFDTTPKDEYNELKQRFNK